MPDQRLKGQEVSIRIVSDNVVESRIDSISTFNDTIALEIKEAGYLGEVVNRFDEILNGYGGDMEFHVASALWNLFTQRVRDRATRKTPGLVFNVVRTDLFTNGETAIYVYKDVNWGEIPTSVASRGDYVKPKLQFKCSERAEKLNALP